MLTNLPIPNRQCDGCTVCCEVLHIQQLEKPSWQLCKHACNGCNIYDNRPQTCKDFNCLWLAGYLEGEARRPDKLGLMFTASASTHPKPSVFCFEGRAGAAQENPAKYVLDKITRKVMVFLHLYNSRQVVCLGPPKYNELMKDFVFNYERTISSDH